MSSEFAISRDGMEQKDNNCPFRARLSRYMPSQRSKCCIAELARGGKVILMRAATISVLCLIVIMSPISGVCNEPEKDSGISFSLPFECSRLGHKGICLDGAFREGLNVVLLDDTGPYNAKTGKTFTSEYFGHVGYPEDDPFKATHLVGSDGCFSVGEEKKCAWDFRIAVIGTEPPTVHLIPPKKNKSPVPKDIELKARSLVEPSETNPCFFKSDEAGEGYTDSGPKVIRAKDVALLMFQVVVFAGEAEENGTAVLVVNKHVFPLKGCCQRGPFFFSVNGKLHLAYEESSCCWRCGERTFVVNDLSTGKPEMVFHVGTSVD